MPGVDAWCALADEVVALGDPAMPARAQQALSALGLADDERSGLTDAIRGRTDPAGRLLEGVAGTARVAGPPPIRMPATPAQMDAALALSQQLLSGPAPTLADRLGAAARGVLAALADDAAGAFVVGLVEAALSLPDAAVRSTALRTVLDVTRDVTVGRLPVAAIVTDTVAAAPSDEDAALVAALLARVPTARLLSGALGALRGGADPAAVLALLQR
ncbi:MAG: hypothetical protein ABJA89_04495, partial [Lapillicoccus sp.]